MPADDSLGLDNIEDLLANPTKLPIGSPKITDPRPSASVEDGAVSRPPAVDAGPNSQLPTPDGYAARTKAFER